MAIKKEITTFGSYEIKKISKEHFKRRHYLLKHTSEDTYFSNRFGLYTPKNLPIQRMIYQMQIICK